MNGERTRVAAYALCVDESGRILLCRIAPWVAAGYEGEIVALARRAVAILAADTATAPDGAP